MVTCRKVEFLHCRREFSERPGYSDMSQSPKTKILAAAKTHYMSATLSPFKSFPISKTKLKNALFRIYLPEMSCSFEKNLVFYINSGG